MSLLPPGGRAPLTQKPSTRWVWPLLTGLGLCLTHGYAPALAVLAPVPLLWSLRHASARQAFYMGLLCGACEAFVLSGMWHAQFALAVLLCLFYALVRALFAVLAQPLGRTPLTAAAAAGLWALVERWQSSIPYSLPTLLGDTQHTGPFLPLARLGATYLVSLQIVWLSGALAACVDAGLASRRHLCPAVLGLLLPLGVWGGLRLVASRSLPDTMGHVYVNVVQGGLPTWFYTRSETEKAWASLPERVYTTLSRRGPPADLTIWPETAVWRTWSADRPFMADMNALSRERGPLLFGVPRSEAGGELYNAAVLLQDGPATFVDKRRLALRAEGQFTPGDQPALLAWGTGALGVVFCLESVVPEYARELTARGAAALVVLAEGSRFGNTPVGRIHAQRSVLRAVETGRTVVHAGQQGYTQVIGPSGAHSAPVPAYTAAVVHEPLFYSSGLTPYVRFGDLTLLPAGLLWGMGLLWASRRRGR